MKSALTSACTTVLLAGYAASAAPDPGGAALERLLPIVESRDTHLDLDSDGTPEITRQFDTHGFVVESVSKHPGDVTESFEVSPDRRTTVRRFEFPGGSWTQETNHYDAEGSWLDREILYGATRDHALDLERESPEGSRLKVEVFAKEGTDWVLKTVRYRTLAYEGGGPRTRSTPAPRPRPVDIRLPVPSWTRSELRSCPWESQGQSANTCGGFVFEQLRSDGLDGLATLVPMECAANGGRRLYLTNGFSVDLSTCGDNREAIDRVIQSTRSMFKVLRCVSGHNAAYARRILEYLSRNKPRLRCLGHLPAAQVPRACSEAPNPAECERMVAERVGAYVVPGSHDIHLIGSDPTTSSGASERNAADILHELAHSAGIPCNSPVHNVSDGERYMAGLAPADRTPATRALLRRWRNADPVYGVNVLCGGGPPAGSPVEDAFTLEPWLNDRGPIPLPGGARYTPPGNLFEMSCTALRRYRASHQCYSFLPSHACPARASAELTERLNSTVTQIDPECRRLGEAHVERIRLARERRAREDAEQAEFLRNLGN